jgi:hypothetical protein
MSKIQFDKRCGVGGFLTYCDVYEHPYFIKGMMSFDDHYVFVLSCSK